VCVCVCVCRPASGWQAVPAADGATLLLSDHCAAVAESDFASCALLSCPREVFSCRVLCMLTACSASRITYEPAVVCLSLSLPATRQDFHGDVANDSGVPGCYCRGKVIASVFLRCSVLLASGVALLLVLSIRFVAFSLHSLCVCADMLCRLSQCAHCASCACTGTLSLALSHVVRK
jgi:hypothetical protein